MFNSISMVSTLYISSIGLAYVAAQNGLCFFLLETLITVTSVAKQVSLHLTWLESLKIVFSRAGAPIYRLRPNFFMASIYRLEKNSGPPPSEGEHAILWYK